MISSTDMPLKGALGAALIVEDNPIIALDTQTMLEELGFMPVKVLTSLSEGIETIARELYNFVILDVKMGDDTSLKFAELLLDRGTRFVFASGYGDMESMPEIFRNHTILSKPYTKDQIASLLSRI
ncbi:response regulator [Roseibium sp. Sym1]|uniref:response regulator n=1 Tax=Roseibium sp. Sym1 TaxID=3016006 RepID=UPI0022B3ED3F|nr:response regulator [Roseibium sp. Sym1]